MTRWTMPRALAVPLLLTALGACAVAADEPAEVLAPGENLVVEGLPSVPAALVDSAGRYADYRSAALLDWHPTRRAILIGTRFADTNQVHEVAAPLGERRQLTFFADRVLGASYHPHLGDYFILAKDKGGNEFYQFYRQNPTDGATTLITDGKSRNTDPVWSTAGKEIVYGSTSATRTTSTSTS